MRLESADDSKLVEIFLRRKDEEAFRILYRRHTPAVYLLVCRLLGTGRVLSEDVLQETWLRVARALRDFRGDSSLRTWVTGIAIRRCLEIFRERSRHPETGLDGDFAVRSDPGIEATRLDLEREIRRLPDGCREVLVLHDLEGYTHDEISSILGIVPGTSKSQLSRARSALRARLNPGGIHERK